MNEAFLRTVAIIVELIFLTAMVTCLLGGLWLAGFDLGIKAKYRRAILMTLVAMGGLGVTFFVVHLISFYPIP